MLTLSELAANDTFVSVVSSEPSRLEVVGGSVTVPMGMSSAVVRVNTVAGNQRPVPVILTARLNGASRSAGVRLEAAVNETNLPTEADFCNVQFPQNINANTGEPVTIFGRLFEAGVTEPVGGPANTYAEVVCGMQGFDPRNLSGWYFIPATYNTQVANDDEFQAAFMAPSPGPYRTTCRFSFDNGASYTDCDDNGAGSNAGLTFVPNDLGTMAVAGAGSVGLISNGVDYDQVGRDSAE